MSAAILNLPASKTSTVDGMDANQRLANAAAAAVLIPGRYYIFDPPVTATAVPAGGPDAWGVLGPHDMEFHRGCYLGFVKDRHVFQATVPPKYDYIPKRQRECYFHVLYVGGSDCVLDTDQSPD